MEETHRKVVVLLRGVSLTPGANDQNGHLVLAETTATGRRAEEVVKTPQTPRMTLIVGNLTLTGSFRKDVILEIILTEMMTIRVTKIPRVVHLLHRLRNPHDRLRGGMEVALRHLIPRSLLRLRNRSR